RMRAASWSRCGGTFLQPDSGAEAVAVARNARGAGVFGGEPLRGGAAQRDRHANAAAEILPILRSATPEQRLLAIPQGGTEGWCPGQTIDVEVTLIEPVVETERLGQANAEAWRGGADLDPAPVRALKETRPEVVGPAASGCTVDLQRMRADCGEHGIEQGDADALAQAVALAGDQRHHNRNGGLK